MIESSVFYSHVTESRTGGRAVSGLERGANEPVAMNGVGFGDILDAVNPLQHLPIVGSAYRAATGDGLSSISRIVGGFIFGGPIGLLGGLFNTILNEVGFGTSSGDKINAFQANKATLTSAAKASHKISGHYNA